jgi:hypothetical protein
MAVTPKQLQNLEKRKRFGKEQPVPKNGGRPRIKPLREAILDDYSKTGATVLKRLKRDHLPLYCAYGFGKPVETVLLGGADDASPIRLDLIDAAREAAKKV